ncbi:MAG TPA: hypothetical protein VF395_05855 [Polyangiaceae bacterium]
MEVTHGGRATLRLGAVSDAAVEYEGELVTGGALYPSRVLVTCANGTVDIRVEGDPPAWLVDIARTTLRTAWRATQTGAEWPRRVNRWRAAKDQDGA